jgi:hypothetical protein
MKMRPLAFFALIFATTCLPALGGCAGTTVGVNDVEAAQSQAITGGLITGTLYVADGQANAIDEFSLSARGNHAPLARIVGPDTRLNSPSDVAVDAQGDIDVPNGIKPEIDEYAPSANGDATPAAILAGPATQLNMPERIALDGSGQMYVRCTQLLAIFAPGSSGNTPPIAVLSGSRTQINASSYPGVAVDAAGRIYTIHNDVGIANAIDIFAPGAHGNVSPSREISGTFTQLNGMVDVEIDTRGTLYVVQIYYSNNQPLGEVLEFPPGAHGNVPPNRIIQGPNTTMIQSYALTIDVRGRVYVSQGGAILVFAPKASGDVAPLYTISGSMTQLNSPTGVAIH